MFLQYVKIEKQPKLSYNRFLMKKQKKAIVVGSGIAGLSIAEILSRNNYQVKIIEKNDTIGGEGSLATQKWYHTGWLYAALPNPAALNGCIQALKYFQEVYSSVFNSSILNVSFNKSGVSYTNEPKGWFSNDPVFFFFSLSTFELSFITKCYWPFYLKYNVYRRLKKVNIFSKRLKHFSEEIKKLLNKWETSQKGYKKYNVFQTSDSKIETNKVIRSLVYNMTKNTEIITNANFKLSHNDNTTSIHINGKTYTPDICVLATGKTLPNQLNTLGFPHIAKKIKSIKSPILVLKKLLNLPNFIRFTPKVDYTINHMKYLINDTLYSTVGSYYHFPEDEDRDISDFETIMCKRLGISKDLILGSYYGIKTEYTGESDRIYNHALKKVNNNTFFALAGKFSQFPLLVHDFAKQNNLSFKPHSAPKINISETIFSKSYPQKIVEDFLKTNKNKQKERIIT